MTEPSSAGNPDGAALPADHPLGPAAPVPPREKEARRAGHESTHDVDTPTADDAPVHGAADDASDTADAPDTTGPDGGTATRTGTVDDGHPDADRREAVLDPSAGSAGHRAAGIRDEQGTHEAGAVPAAFEGEGAPDPGHRHPEDAATGSEAWDGDEASR